MLYHGFDAAAVDKARYKVRDFRAWIAAHRDELTAIQILYAGTRPLRLSLADLRQLKDALARPPLASSPVALWRAFEAVEAAQVQGHGGKPLADLVSLARHALTPEVVLTPYAKAVQARFATWLAEREAQANFTADHRHQPAHRDRGFPGRLVRPGRRTGARARGVWGKACRADERVE
ncbi:MAG: type I restriction-modification enzyme R subunit C-terminal domain-containing protein [Panacagrimonas sp.]